MTRDAKRELRAIQFSTLDHAGHRHCPSCGTLAYCRGKTYEGQRCRSCFTARGTRKMIAEEAS